MLLKEYNVGDVMPFVDVVKWLDMSSQALNFNDCS